MSVQLYTPYTACKFVNAELKARGIEKVLPPQMFYNYVSKGFIKADSEKKITADELAQWFDKYVARLELKASQSR